MTARTERATPAEALRRALTTVERLQRRIDDYERERHEPIAVIGMACRFPGGVVDPESYWDLLLDGRDAVTEVPPDRWDVDAFYDPHPRTAGKMSSRWGGFLDRVDAFDHEFFGIPRREAVVMDPQHRWFLEAAWEALEDAGLAPTSLAGSLTGVYLAAYGTEYSAQTFADIERINAYSVLGGLHSVAAGRVSYLLDLRGPNIVVDTACSSSLVAVHQACHGLRLGEADLAVCGAANAVIAPQASISLSQLNESFVGDGRIKTFDAAADGFVRSEGCGVVILKRLSDALRDGDRPYAVIRGSAVNQDGRGAGLTAPNGSAHRALLRRALAGAGVRPEEVSFVETHGTGTKLGDPIEVEALADVYGHPDGSPVYLGAVKTNLGHLEAAAGMAGLIKAALSVERGMIPPNLHFTRLSPHISFDGTTFAVPTEPTPWPRQDRPRLAGVSSFGLGGTNAHVIVEQPPPAATTSPGARRPASVLALSAKSETALLKLARRYHDRLLTTSADVADLCASANAGRAQFAHRLAAVGSTAEELVERLADHVRGDAGPGLVAGRAAAGGGSDVVFLFSGLGSQHLGMAAELYRTQPTFRGVLDHCDEVMRPTLGVSLLATLYPDIAGRNSDADRTDVDRTDAVEHAVPALFAVECALAELWRSWGVEPVAVMGHSLGEYAAACFAGVMSLDDGLQLVAERAELLRQLPGDGAMAAVFASEARVLAEIAGQDPALVGVAAVNGPANVTVSGRAEAVRALCGRLESAGVVTKPVRVARSGHSPLVEPVLPALREALGRVKFSAPRIPLVSNVTGDVWPWDQVPDVDYWCRHTREPVRFADGVRSLTDLGYRTFIEIGPGSDLLGMALSTMPSTADVLMLPSLRPRHGDWDVLLSAVSRLYVQGADLDWAGFDADYEPVRVRLPRYPFERIRCWHEVRPVTPVDGDGELDPDQELWTSTGGDRSRQHGPDPVQASAAAGRDWDLMTSRELFAIDPADRCDALVGQLVAGLRQALGYRSTTLDPDEPLSNLGLDSLMAVELRNEIENRLGVALTVAGFLRGATVRSVARTVVDQLTGAATAAGGPAADDQTPISRVQRVEDVAALLLRQVEELPDDQLETTTGAE